MTSTIPTSRGRLYLMGILGIGLVGAVILLFALASGGAIGSKNLQIAVIKFLGFYVPLLTLVATFFFGNGSDPSLSRSQSGTFYFAVFIVSVWVLTPIFLLLSGLFIEEVLEYMDKLIPLGQSLALMALGYYFKKS